MPWPPTTAEVSNPVGQGYGLRLGNRLFRLAVGPGRELEALIAEQQAERLQTQENPQDFQDPFAAIFSRIDFTGGGGLRYAHRRDASPSDRTRFWASNHIITVPESAHARPTLSVATDGSTLYGTSGLSSGATRDRSHAPLVNQYRNMLFVAERGILTADRANLPGILRYDNVTGVSPSSVTEFPRGGSTGSTWGALVSDGTYLYAMEKAAGGTGTGLGTHRRAPTGTWTVTWSEAEADDAWFVKGRVLFTDEATGNLKQLAAGTGSTDVLLNPGTPGAATSTAESRFFDVAEAGDAILCAHGSGVIYVLGLDDTATLVQVGTFNLPGGERPISLCTGPGGIVLVGTDLPLPNGERLGRLWVGFVDGFNVVNLQLLREWHIIDAAVGAYVEHMEWHLAGPSRFARMGDDAFFAAGPSKPGHETEHLDGGIWRYHFATAGLTREADWGRDDSRRPHYMTAVGETTITSTDGLIQGTEGEASDKAWVERSRVELLYHDGWLITPVIDHFTTAPKAWSQVAIETTDSSGGLVDVYYSTDEDAVIDPDHPSWALILSSGAIGRSSANLNVVSPRIVFKIVIEGDIDFRAIEVKAYPGVSDWLVSIPVNISDHIERPGRRRLRVRKLGNVVWRELLGLVDDTLEMEIYDPPLVIFGQIRDVKHAQVVGNPRGSAGIAALVTILGRPTSATDTSLPGGTWGIGYLWGQGIWAGRP